MILKVKGLVVKESNIGDSDKYLTLLTQSHGRLFMRARGVRSLKSKYLSSAQLLSYSEFTIFQSSGFNKMNEAQLIENFYDIRLDLEKLSLAAYMAELSETLSVENRDENGLLFLILNSLYALAYTEKPAYIIKGAFELRAMSAAGFMPNLTGCEACGRNVSDRCYFDLSGGNLICGECYIPNSGERNRLESVRLDENVLAALRYVISAVSERIFSFNIHGDSASGFSKVCENFVAAQIGSRLKTLEFYNGLLL